MASFCEAWQAWRRNVRRSRVRRRRHDRTTYRWASNRTREQEPEMGIGHKALSDDQNAKAELSALAAEFNGSPPPVEVLARARSTNSALHRYFTWDDTEAGDAYRLIEARRVIRVLVKTDRPIRVPVQAVVQVMTAPAPVAEPVFTTTALSLADLLHDIQVLEDRYRSLKDRGEIFTRIRAALYKEEPVSPPRITPPPRRPDITQATAHEIASKMSRGEKATILYMKPDGSYKPVSGAAMSLLIRQIWRRYDPIALIETEGTDEHEIARLRPDGKILRGLLARKS